MFEISIVSPESVGIGSQQIENMILRLKKNHIPMHSLLLMRYGKLIYEGYYHPYNKEKLHRMFSISKSMVSLGIGYMITNGKLHADDKIAALFPEKCPADVHPWIQEMTLQNMLEMRTCYSRTSYKLGLTNDWVESFFIATPDHPPGTIFHYDTGSSHVLCALIEKLTGIPFWDFMKNIVFRGLDLSKDSYMLKDPNGISMGGSGLMCTPMDLMKIGYFISCKGTVFGEKRISEKYIAQALSFISPTIMKAPLPSEGCGYGMQFWKTERGGNVCYGIGGQLLIMQPQEELICVTTADTQGYSGGNQLIYNAFYEDILDKIADNQTEGFMKAPVCNSELSDCLTTEGTHGDMSNDLCKVSKESAAQASLARLTAELAIAPVSGKYQTLIQHQVNGRIYKIEKNNIGIRSMSVSFNKLKGELFFRTDKDTWEIPFGFGCCREITFPIYQMCAVSGGAWVSEDCLYIRCHICDSSVSSVHFQLHFSGNQVVIYMKKTDESLFSEFSSKHLIGYYL